MEVREEEKNYKVSFRKVIDNASVEQRWYLLSLLFGLVLLFICFIESFDDKGLGITVKHCFVFMVLLSSIGVVNYAYNIFIELSDNLIWKSLFSLVFVFIVTFDLSIAEGFINESLKVPSSPFVYTKTVISIILVPFMVLLLTIVISFLSVAAIISNPVFKLFGYFNLYVFKGSSVKYGRLTFIFRYSVVICLGWLGGNALSSLEGYQKIIGDTAKQYAYTFEMEKYTYCDSSEGEHFAYLDSNTVIVGIKADDEYSFTVRPCNETVVASVEGTIDGIAKEILESLRN